MDTKKIELIGDNHELFSLETPLRDDAFVKSNDEKIKNIEKHFTKIVDELGLDLNDDSISGTPYRVAKMYVKEIFSGLDPENKPKISLFDNKYNYNKMLIEKNINLNSTCEHHFLPITGKAHVSYISSGKVIGLSKLNRIVQYYSHRPPRRFTRHPTPPPPRRQTTVDARWHVASIDILYAGPGPAQASHWLGFRFLNSLLG